MKNKLKIALAQLDCREGNKEANLQKIEWSIEQAHVQQADILVIPEMMLTGFLPREEMLKLAETREGSSMRRIQEQIRRFPVSMIYTFFGIRLRAADL
ncbi:nitrilase-related carbon-nitrogen hydrolase [Ferviditalea candida]|uniref:Nitrilase-related carbon-nitrogen hydrolase n=1 Tax=Ferviditalea candida TaxID=3108399 RepID=A0ABU5ZGA3_9BACL|nr:nitrilase-related carbon-nitrogen hydrolase [Paenibacillaceae bacterium T2]